MQNPIFPCYLITLNLCACRPPSPRNMSPKVVIAGAGLVGALNAAFFAKRGWTVEVYEQREDIRTLEHVAGRSINLAMSIRGKEALEYVGLKDYIMEQGVKMFARFVHNQDGVTTNRQPYGKPGEHILSINRRHLNEVMITLAEKNEKVTFHFGHKLLYCRVGQEAVFERLSDGERIMVSDADLICGCDGAYSSLRRSLMAFPRFNFSQEYISHGYIELNILPKDQQFAMEPNVFHLWPRGDFVLIALANKDKTFTVTLFAPFLVFETHLNNTDSVISFFKKYFPDALELIGRDAVAHTFETVRPSPLMSIKCEPHHFGNNVVLLGDAAHAMVPFYGQGMNCGFEDCLVLSEKLDECEDDIVIVHWLTDFSQTTGIAQISFNRFLTIVQPLWQWTLKITDSEGKAELVFQWLSSLILICPMFLMDFAFVPVWSGSGCMAASTGPLWAKVFFPIHGIKLIIEFCLHLIFYSSMLHELKHMAGQGASLSTYEARLTVAGFLLSAIAIVNACCSTAINLIDGDHVKPAQLVLLDSADLLAAICQPYILLAMSSLLRQNIPAPLCMRNPVQINLAPQPALAWPM